MSLNRYPDREFVALREALAGYLNTSGGCDITPAMVWAANGSNEVMLQLLQAFGGPGRVALSFAPTYSMYPEYARDTMTEWVAGHRAEDFSLDLDAARRLVEERRPSVVLLPSPNNPTGTALPPEAVSMLCEAAASYEPGGLVVVDEAYGEFRRAGTPSALELLPRHRNLVVTRTMSKAFALAGARLGYLAADPAICDAIRVVRLPYHLSAVTQATALAALRHAPELLGRVDDLRAERDATVAWLREQGLEVADSDANFVLFGRFADRHALWQGLVDRGVLIRETGPDGWLRVSIGTADEMAAFRHALVETMDDPADGGPRMSRTARIERTTKESKVTVEVDLDGTGRSEVSTGVGFYDHMLDAFARHSLTDLVVRTEGDTHIDAHHTVEDTAIVLGQALREALGDKVGIRRFGDATVPLDEALVQAVVDVSGRPYCVHTGEPEGQVYVAIGGTGAAYQGSLTRHVFETISFHAHLALHVRVLAGRDPHHLVEAQFKAFARALPRRRRPRPARDRRAVDQGQPVTPDVVVLDYGSGNLRSVVRAVERAGAAVTLTGDFATALDADGLVVPGVGAYAACMAGLRAIKGERIIGRRLAGGRPVLGICVGMQVLFAGGVEHGVETDGLRRVARAGERLAGRRGAAHGLEHRRGAGRARALFAGIEDERFYFVHSYAARSWDLRRPTTAPRAPLVTWAEHGGDRFVAAVENGPLWATQFHPEKSGDAGAELLKNWVASLRA